MTKAEAIALVAGIDPDDFGKVLGAMVARLIVNFGPERSRTMVIRILDGLGPLWEGSSTILSKTPLDRG